MARANHKMRIEYPAENIEATVSKEGVALVSERTFIASGGDEKFARGEKEAFLAEERVDNFRQRRAVLPSKISRSVDSKGFLLTPTRSILQVPSFVFFVFHWKCFIVCL